MLCTLCSTRGVNVKELYECRECGDKVCSHYCSFKESDKTAVCHKCLAVKRKEGSP